jgi:hypothetical protein
VGCPGPSLNGYSQWKDEIIRYNKLIPAIAVAALIALIVVGLAWGKQSAPQYSKAQITSMIYSAFGTGWRGQTMLCIAKRESNLDPSAVNWSDRHPTSEGTFKGSFGLFQIGALHVQHSRGSGRQIAGGNVYRLLDPKVNIAVAKRLARGGLGPWNGGC